MEPSLYSHRQSLRSDKRAMRVVVMANNCLLHFLFVFFYLGEMSTKVPSIKLKIDPRDLQIQTFTVEKLLEPLIIQVF